MWNDKQCILRDWEQKWEQKLNDKILEAKSKKVKKDKKDALTMTILPATSKKLNLDLEK